MHVEARQGLYQPPLVGAAVQDPVLRPPGLLYPGRAPRGPLPHPLWRPHSSRPTALCAIPYLGDLPPAVEREGQRQAG
eukprot:13279753-Alexandrium_andersonii.AAC.1